MYKVTLKRMKTGWLLLLFVANGKSLVAKQSTELDDELKCRKKATAFSFHAFRLDSFARLFLKVVYLFIFILTCFSFSFL